MAATEDELDKIWGRGGWFTDVLARLEGQSLPCVGQERIYDAASMSPIARRAASVICTSNGGCPIAEECARAGRESDYQGVWGGKDRGIYEVEPNSERSIARWMKRLLQDSGEETGGLLHRVASGIPSFVSVIKRELPLQMVAMTPEQCLSLTEPDAARAVTLRRSITRDAIMLGAEVAGMARIDLTCRQYASCIAPWHMRWGTDLPDVEMGQFQAKNLALALHLKLRKGYEDRATAPLVGYDAKFIKYLWKTAIIMSDRPFVFGTASDILTWHAAATKTPPAKGQWANAVLSIVRAGQELSCIDIEELMAVGQEEY